MDYASVKGIPKGFNKLDVSFTFDEDCNTVINRKDLFTKELNVVKKSKLLNVEEDFLRGLDFDKDYGIIGIHNIEESSFEESSFYRFLATTNRFYENDRFISSDWVLPIEVRKGEDRFILTTDLVEGKENIKEVADEVFKEDTEIEKVYFSKDSKSVVFSVFDN